MIEIIIHQFCNSNVKTRHRALISSALLLVHICFPSLSLSLSDSLCRKQAARSWRHSGSLWRCSNDEECRSLPNKKQACQQCESAWKCILQPWSSLEGTTVQANLCRDGQLKWLLSHSENLTLTVFEITSVCCSKVLNLGEFFLMQKQINNYYRPEP